MNDYQIIGLMEKWEVKRVPQWRGWELVGSTGGKIIVYFFPDAAVMALIEATERPPTP